MATHEDGLKDLREKNNELVQKVQYWKMTAAQRENEKLELMKEINELRLKVIRLKSGGAAEARKLDAALQTASEDALSHLVQASSAVARTIELAKTYTRARQDFETMSPRWSNMSNSTEKVHRVPPLMMGGQSIQPVVSLSRTLNLSGQRSRSRSPNSNQNVTMRAVPVHMLQDVYIPLTRIDTRDLLSNNETEQEAITADDSEENLFDTSMEEPTEESQSMTNEDGYESSRRLEIVTEDIEPADEEMTPPRVKVENPLEGPSWLLDAMDSQSDRPSRTNRRPNLEPDSTTQGEEAATPAAVTPQHSPEGAGPASEPLAEPSPEPARVFTPTVRRRKRAEPPPEPGPSPGPGSPVLTSACWTASARVLQVLVPKMRLDGAGASPPKRALRFDAPSPNGATDSRVIVSEEGARKESEPPGALTPPDSARAPRGGAGARADSGDSDSGSGAERVSEGRTRRARKPVTYKEKPLNRKLRR